MAESSEEDSDSLPEDVLIEVLSRLPVKSLVRLRCVSKLWRDLIGSPHFVSRHLMSERQESVCLTRYEDGLFVSVHDPNSADLSMLSQDMSIVTLLLDQPDHCLLGCILLGACNGIVCLRVCDVFIICNPALGEFERIPPRPWAVPLPAVDVVERNICHGCGYDPVGSSYKIVYAYHLSPADEEYNYAPHTHPIEVDVYDSSSNCWRTISDDSNCSAVFHSEYVHLMEPVYLNGVCHWDERTGRCLLLFDLSDEVFRRFEYPDAWNEEEQLRGNQSLDALHDRLAMIAWVQEPSLIKIWAMKEYGVKESWTVDYVIGPCHIFRPFFCWNSEWMLVEDKDGRLASIAVQSKETHAFMLSAGRRSWEACLFKESLIRLSDVIVASNAMQCNPM